MFASPPMPPFDCQTCGACCCNPDENRAEGYPWYVAIPPGSRLVTRPDLRLRYVALDPDGEPHLRLGADGRCAALQGRLGQRVRCEVYHHRPPGCRAVQPGDPECRKARAERGIPDP